MTQLKHVVLYARLSVTKEESVSIERQLYSERQYAEARGWTVIGEFVDDGVSATANSPDKRAGWRALLATPGFDAVIIWKVDRLARKVLDFLNVDQMLQKRGAGLIAVEDPIDMTTAQGRAFATILAVFGEMEAESIRARIKAARAQMYRDGRWPGGGIPYGYRSIAHPNGVGRWIEKDPDRIEWLEKMVRRALAGEAVNSVTTWLTNQHAPTPYRKRATVDGKWNRQTVLGLLRNPILAGMLPYNPGRGRDGNLDHSEVWKTPDGEPVVYDELAIITVDEWESLQTLLDQRTSPQCRKKGERVSTSPFLSKAVICNACGVYLCRGTNQGKAVLCCPQCRQIISRSNLDPYLINRLLTERGDVPYGASTVAGMWAYVGENPKARREVLLSQVESLRVRRGVVGKYFDADRILLTWKPVNQQQEAA